MDQVESRSALLVSQSEGDINKPSPKEQHLNDSLILTSESLQLPTRSHTIDRPSTARPTDASHVLMTTQSPSTPRPTVDADPTATATLTAQGGSRTEQRVRRKRRRLVFSLIFNGAQTASIIVLLVVGSRHKSTSDPQQSEWRACSKPLGAWDAIWAGKLCFDFLLTFWSFRRARAIHMSAAPSDVESGHNTFNNQPSPLSATHPTVDQDTTPTANNSPHSSLRRRLSIFSTIFTIIWFSVTNNLVFTSTFTCRLTSPHLWWLTLALLAVIYVTILPFVVVGIAYFVVIPLVFGVLNMFLVCTGRPPLRIPYIKSSVGKLPKSVVNRIPLVVYIPPPPEGDSSENELVAKPEPIYEYPPKPPTPTLPKRRFAFLRPKSLRKGALQEKEEGDLGQEKVAESWEDNWEHGKYPFVRLEGNRATCAICLMDFEEPKRVKGKNKDPSKHTEVEPTNVLEETQIQVPNAGDGLILEDAGEGAQPLRLLACGHVFHQTCLDPWLTGVSGRCPMCQRPVEISRSRKKRNRDRNP